MKLLILGGSGMAGHLAVQYFSQNSSYTTSYTSRDKEDPNSIYLDAGDFEKVSELIRTMKPDVILNCIGLLNEDAAARMIDSIKLNSLLPHLLAQEADRYGGKVVHISTDCVFLGKKGLYRETELPDGQSIYAKTKSLGELNLAPHLTLRTSIIGPERKLGGIGLFNWFMSQTGVIKGYKKVLWNGVTTLELAKATDIAIKQNLNGLYHLTAPSIISKHDLLQLIKTVFQKEDVEIIQDEEQIIDRTLIDTRKELQYGVPEYPQMLNELKKWMTENG